MAEPEGRRHLVGQARGSTNDRVLTVPNALSVVRLVLGQALRPVAVGAILGVAGALGASRVLSSQLFGVSPTDPLTIVAVLATLIGVALVASAVPARPAAAVDPTRALQAE